ncbi:unnamed protein product, partial [Phaeothamnion confervicola]
MPARVSAWVVDAEGKPVFATHDRSMSPVGDRPYFQELKSGKQELLVTPLIVGRISGENIFLIGRRIERKGAFAGAVLIAVPVSAMSDFLQSLELGAGSTVSVFRTDGWLVARYPPPDQPMNLANYVLFTEHLPRSPTGSYDAISPADRVARIVGYRKIDQEPLVALASIAVASHFAPFWDQLRFGLALLGFLVLTLAFVTYALFRALGREEHNRKELKDALGRNTLLLQEIHHRVKNNLQAVAAFIQLSPLDAESKLAMNLRLAAMTAIHEQAYRKDEYAVVSLQSYLSQLIKNLRTSYGSDIDITSDLQAMEVDRDQALPVGLITNEVLSNAFKHAFPTNKRGVIHVGLSMIGDRQAELVIRDNGVGHDSTKPSSGIGARLIRGLVDQLGG